jgi:glutamyl endopeptidase
MSSLKGPKNPDETTSSTIEGEPPGDRTSDEVPILVREPDGRYRIIGTRQRPKGEDAHMRGKIEVVTVETKHTVQSERQLEKAKVDVQESAHGKATSGHKPADRRHRPAPSLAGWPQTYIDPKHRYVLVEEPDKRYRIVGQDPVGRVTPRAKAKAPQAGQDNRVRVNDTTTWPNCVHGHVIITFPDNNQYIGSGTMVNKHHVVTAGHVVYSKSNGGWATSIQFNAAQNDSSVPFGSAWATRLVSFSGWTNDGDEEWDIGMLILNEDLGNETGWMGLISTADNNLSEHQITVSGYPGDKGGQEMWAAAAPIVGVQSEQLQYDAFTKGGDSGSGVYGVWQGIAGEHVCAAHTLGANGIPNTGTRIASDKFPVMVSWMTQW